MVTEKDYLELVYLANIGRQDELSRYIAIELLWRKTGYRTLMRGVYFSDEIPKSSLEQICVCLAKRLNTDVVMGDFAHLGYDDLIIYTASGKLWPDPNVGKKQ